MAAPHLPPLLRDGDRLTRDEFMRRYEAMPDLKGAELIDGIVYMPSPVSNVHAEFHARMSYWLGSYAAVAPDCRYGITGTWLMSSDSAPQPDLSLSIRPEHGGQSGIEGGYAAGAPELVVEISHTTTAKDKGVKLRLYERSGVREYIMVMPVERQIVWRELESGSYREIAPDEDGLYRSRVFPGLWLDPAALWAGDLAGLAAAVPKGVAQR
jgi:Uma2 family endonuclease